MVSESLEQQSSRKAFSLYNCAQVGRGVAGGVDSSIAAELSDLRKVDGLVGGVCDSCQRGLAFESKQSGPSSS